jgi:hypothetical protein
MMIGASSLAKQLKTSHPNLKIGFIGSHASALPQEVIQYDYVDFAFINEGVYALFDLLESDLKTDLDKIPGIWYKEHGLPRPSAPGRIVQTTRYGHNNARLCMGLITKRKLFVRQVSFTLLALKFFTRRSHTICCNLYITWLFVWL